MSIFERNKQNATTLSRHSAATVVGLGATGFSVVRYLCARNIDVTVVDTREQPSLAAQLGEQFPAVKTHFGGLADASVINASLLVVSPGISLKQPELVIAKNNGAEIVGDVELFLQENDKPVIAITGSNGKSTVTTLVGEMCAKSGMKPLVAGNIGKPVLEALVEQQEFDIAVLELSSFQLETTSKVPAQASAILNISEDHMDRYDSMGDYVLAKARILRGASRAVLPRHDELLQQITNINEVLTFGLDEPANDSDFGVMRKKSGRWLMKGKQRLMLLRDIPLIGLHNVSNVLSAFALTDFLKLPLEKVVDAVKAFKGLPHRMQKVASKDGVTWVNDSKATNVGAALTALENLEGNVIWLAGGQGKGADFAPLKMAMNDSIKQVLLFGEDAPLIEQALDNDSKVKSVGSLTEAVELALANAQSGDVVILSPACASFDMFKSFEHRGQVFAEEVQRVLGTAMEAGR